MKFKLFLAFFIFQSVLPTYSCDEDEKILGKRSIEEKQNNEENYNVKRVKLNTNYIPSWDEEHIKELSDLADSCFNKEEYEKSLELYFYLEDLGETSCIFKIAFIYDNGLGVKENGQKAFEYYLKAEKRGDLDASYNVGYFYKNGNDCEKSLDKAYTYFLKAGRAGDSQALYKIGRMFENYHYEPFNAGISSAKESIEKALTYYKAAAKNGYLKGYHRLGDLYSQDLAYEEDTIISKNERKGIFNYLKSYSCKYNENQTTEVGITEKEYNKIIQTYNKIYGELIFSKQHCKPEIYVRKFFEDNGLSLNDIYKNFKIFSDFLEITVDIIKKFHTNAGLFIDVYVPKNNDSINFKNINSFKIEDEVFLSIGKENCNLHEEIRLMLNTDDSFIMSIFEKSRNLHNIYKEIVDSIDKNKLDNDKLYIYNSLSERMKMFNCILLIPDILKNLI
ncbi:MAG TPA: tetratricopeptide repeat protein, partial [Alphaproteobacteria bacterium]|nr:tetratricopeptide repeat protein [Alphaproteobacteria bacterium]